METWIQLSSSDESASVARRRLPGGVEVVVLRQSVNARATGDSRARPTYLECGVPTIKSKIKDSNISDNNAKFGVESSFTGSRWSDIESVAPIRAENVKQRSKKLRSPLFDDSGLGKSTASSATDEARS